MWWVTRYKFYESSSRENQSIAECTREKYGRARCLFVTVKKKKNGERKQKRYVQRVPQLIVQYFNSVFNRMLNLESKILIIYTSSTQNLRDAVQSTAIAYVQLENYCITVEILDLDICIFNSIFNVQGTLLKLLYDSRGILCLHIYVYIINACIRKYMHILAYAECSWNTRCWSEALLDRIALKKFEKYLQAARKRARLFLAKTSKSDTLSKCAKATKGCALNRLTTEWKNFVFA